MKLRKSTICFLSWILIFLSGCGADPTSEIPTDCSLYQMSMDETETLEETIPDTILTEYPHTQPEETESGPNVVAITISAAGDVTLGNHQNQDYARSFNQMYDQQDSVYFLQNVKDIFSQDDFTIVNFEGVLTFAEEKQEKTYSMKGLPAYVDILTEGSVEAVGFGNNHRLDYLTKGSDDTRETFEEAGITYAYDKITGIYTTKDISIGIVSVNEVSQGAGVEKYLQDGIEELMEEDKCQLVIVCCHWGIERENYPEEYQMELGKKCIDWGADLVLGSHPHVLQGVELYRGKFIVYSLANFCFGGNRNPVDKDTMIFQQTFTFVDDMKTEDLSAKVIPCSVSSVANKNDFCPTPASGEEYDRILKRINQYSAPFSVFFDEEGAYNSEE
ncbi:MAG TPA: CapA family protein [Lachnospiraceae bacterium]|nr:CapA family protein [Lachnospiraceae bacterium]